MFHVFNAAPDGNPEENNPQHQNQPDPQYPETLQSFTDGIKGDVFEMFNSIHKSFKMLLPTSFSTVLDDGPGDDEILEER
jgi:hypothetical protein